MALAPPSTQLGCGRDIDEVWDRIDRAPDAHELTCPYCQAARADLADLATATRALRDDDATNPDLEPSPGVLDRILAVAHAEVRRGRRLPLDEPSTDPTSTNPTGRGATGVDATSVNTVSEQAVTATIRRTGDQTPDVQIRRCVLTETQGDEHARPPDARPSGRGPASVAVSLRVSITEGHSVVEVSTRLRAAVIEAVMREVGMHVVSVDINVEDLHDA